MLAAAITGAPGDEAPAAAPAADPELFAETFDAHWEALRDGYCFFERYGVDWEAERREHRPRALAAADADHFAWELARLVNALPDAHVSFIPSTDTMLGRWSYPELETVMIGRRAYVVGWPPGTEPEAPAAFADHPRPCPEILAVQGEPLHSVAEILAAGPLGSTFDVRLGWPDGAETDHVVRRPDAPNLPPKKAHFGRKWLVTGRVGDVGYMRVRTFDPKLGTLGPDGKMTTMLRAALRELDDTEGLILDFSRNGGGMVAASDPFLGNLIERTLSYRWGHGAGKSRVIRPRRPRYAGAVVCIVDERSASGGEWAARILRDAGRATVVGGRSMGAEAAVRTSDGPDGSKVMFSAWPMVEPGREPFQDRGVTVDHFLPLTIEAVREHGRDEARRLQRRSHLAKALELLGAPAEDVDALFAMAEAADALEGEEEEAQQAAPGGSR